MSVLLTTLLPLIIQYVPGIIRTAEGLFGPKTGPTKLKVSTDLLKQITDALAAADKIPGTPDETVLATIIETVVHQMKATGTLVSANGSTAGIPSLPNAR